MEEEEEEEEEEEDLIKMMKWAGLVISPHALLHIVQYKYSLKLEACF
jgi:hypothetical protein